MQYALKHKNCDTYFAGFEFYGEIISTDELPRAFFTKNYENILFLKKLFKKFSCGEFEIVCFSSYCSNDIETKPRLIDANELYDYIQKEKAWKQDTFKRPQYGRGKYDAYYEMLDIIKQRPTIEFKEGETNNEQS